MSYTIRNLGDLEDVAVSHGFGEVQEVRFAHGDLDSKQSGLSHQVVKPGRRHAFAHRHSEAEEIYVVISGSGRVNLDGRLEDVSRLDAIRVDPAVTRAFEAGDEGLELLVFSPRTEGDAEIVKDFSWE